MSTEKGMSDPEPLDVRLLDAVAMCLCWAEFTRHAQRDDDPASYWAKMSQDARQRYYRDADALARVMRSDMEVKIVPLEPDAKMIAAARVVRPALRAESHVRDVWRAMLSESPRYPGRQPW